MTGRKSWPRRSDSGKIFTLKEYLELFHDIENAEDRMLEANADLERNMKICQGIKYMLTSYRTFYEEKKKASTVLATFDNIYE